MGWPFSSAVTVKGPAEQLFSDEQMQHLKIVSSELIGPVLAQLLEYARFSILLPLQNKLNIIPEGESFSARAVRLAAKVIFDSVDISALCIGLAQRLKDPEIMKCLPEHDLSVKIIENIVNMLVIEENRAVFGTVLNQLQEGRVETLECYFSTCRKDWQPVFLKIIENIDDTWIESFVSAIMDPILPSGAGLINFTKKKCIVYFLKLQKNKLIEDMGEADKTNDQSGRGNNTFLSVSGKPFELILSADTASPQPTWPIAMGALITHCRMQVWGVGISADEKPAQPFSMDIHSLVQHFMQKRFQLIATQLQDQEQKERIKSLISIFSKDLELKCKIEEIDSIAQKNSDQHISRNIIQEYISIVDNLSSCANSIDGAVRYIEFLNAKNDDRLENENFKSALVGMVKCWVFGSSNAAAEKKLKSAIIEQLNHVNIKYIILFFENSVMTDIKNTDLKARIMALKNPSDAGSFDTINRFLNSALNIIQYSEEIIEAKKYCDTHESYDVYRYELIKNLRSLFYGQSSDPLIKNLKNIQGTPSAASPGTDLQPRTSSQILVGPLNLGGDDFTSDESSDRSDSDSEQSQVDYLPGKALVEQQLPPAPTPDPIPKVVQENTAATTISPEVLQLESLQLLPDDDSETEDESIESKSDVVEKSESGDDFEPDDEEVLNSDNNANIQYESDVESDDEDDDNASVQYEYESDVESDDDESESLPATTPSLFPPLPAPPTAREQAPLPLLNCVEVATYHFNYAYEKFIAVLSGSIAAAKNNSENIAHDARDHITNLFGSLCKKAEDVINLNTGRENERETVESFDENTLFICNDISGNKATYANIIQHGSIEQYIQLRDKLDKMKNKSSDYVAEQEARLNMCWFFKLFINTTETKESRDNAENIKQVCQQLLTHIQLLENESTPAHTRVATAKNITVLMQAYSAPAPVVLSWYSSLFQSQHTKQCNDLKEEYQSILTEFKTVADQVVVSAAPAA